MTRKYRECDCKNCRRVGATASILLAIASDPHRHLNSSEVSLWNEDLEKYPCLKKEKVDDR